MSKNRNGTSHRSSNGASNPGSGDSSFEYERLLRGEISSEQYVRILQRDVRGARMAQTAKVGRYAKRGTTVPRKAS
jgi:hypothetical protein